MSFEINSVILGGNLTRDVVLRDLPSGQKVAALTVASNRTYVVGGEKKKEVSFFDVDVWGVSAVNCHKYLKKGSPVVVTGRLKQDQWKSDTGENRSRVKILASNVQFLSTTKSDAPAASDSQEENSFSNAPEGWSE